jgi:hypothetical protein
VIVFTPTRHTGDDPIRVEMARTLADGSLPGDKYSLVLPVLGAVALRVGDWLGLGDLLLDNFSQIVLCGWLWVVARVRYVGTSAVASRLAALLAASMLTVYAMGFNAEVFSATTVSAGLLMLVTARGRNIVLPALLIGLGGANIPAQLPAIAVALAAGAWWFRRWQVLVPVLAMLATIVADVRASTGHWGLSKYPNGETVVFEVLPWGTVVDFGYPLIFGLVAILFSFGRGLMFYVPTLAVAGSRMPRETLVFRALMCVYGALLVVTYAKWWAWYGGVTFGPRFFLTLAVPGAIVCANALSTLTASPTVRRLALASTLLSTWVMFVGISFGITPRTAARCIEDEYRLELLCWYSAEYSTLLAPFWDRVWASDRAWICAVALAAASIAACGAGFRAETRAITATVVGLRQSRDGGDT